MRATPLLPLCSLVGILACGESSPSVTPSPTPTSAVRLATFTDPASSFSTSDVRDVQEQVMSRISSFTDTTGLRSPHSFCGETGAGSAGAADADGGAGLEEHAHRNTPRTIGASVRSSITAACKGWRRSLLRGPPAANGPGGCEATIRRTVAATSSAIIGPVEVRPADQPTGE